MKFYEFFLFVTCIRRYTIAVVMMVIKKKKQDCRYLYIILTISDNNDTKPSFHLKIFVW